MITEAYVIVSADYPPHMGGVERYSWYLAGELKNRGYSVFVVSSSMKGEPRRSTDERGITVLRFPSIWLIPNRMPVPLPTAMWKEFTAELSLYNSIRLIAQTNLYLLCLQGLYFASSHHIKSMMIIHGSNYVCLGKSLVDKIEHFYERWIIKSAGKNNTHFVSVSQASMEFAAALGCKVKTIAYNAIDYTEIDEIRTENRMSVKDAFCLSQDTKIFTFVGRIIREKGVLQLADAFKSINTDRYKVALVMIGDGPLFDELKNKSNNKIILTGQLPHQEVISFLKQSDCFILPSDSEGFPTTILEAAACGCYVIAAPFGGQKEAAEKVNGYIMRDNSVDSIYQAFMYYLENAQSLSEIAEEGKKRLKRDINWKSTTDRIIDTFAEDE